MMLMLRVAVVELSQRLLSPRSWISTSGALQNKIPKDEKATTEKRRKVRLLGPDGEDRGIMPYSMAANLAWKMGTTLSKVDETEIPSVQLQAPPSEAKRTRRPRTKQIVFSTNHDPKTVEVKMNQIFENHKKGVGVEVSLKLPSNIVSDDETMKSYFLRRKSITRRIKEECGAAFVSVIEDSESVASFYVKPKPKETETQPVDSEKSPDE